MPTDFVHSENPEVFSFLHGEGLMPDYVINSDVITPDDCEQLSDRAFADSSNRLYPCHTKAACWESAAYFAGTGQEDERVKSAIEKMAAVHHIEDDVRTVFNKFEQEFDKAAAAAQQPAEERFALTLDWEGVEGKEGTQNLYPIATEMQCLRSGEKAASDYRCGKLPFDVFHKVATNIVAAHPGNVEDLPADVQHYGAGRLPDPYAGSIFIQMRKQAGVAVEPYEAVLEEMRQATELDITPEEMMEYGVKAASLMRELDKLNGITKYSFKMKDPYDILFTGPSVKDVEKHAAAHVEVLGIQVPVTDMVNVSDAKIDRCFSTKVATVVKEAKAILAGANSMEKSAAASAKLAELDESARKSFLTVLAEVGW